MGISWAMIVIGAVACWAGLAMAAETAPATAPALPQGKNVEYHQGDAVLEGYLVYPEARSVGKLPAVIVVHEWWGLNDYARGRARQIAALGYVALAADIYGKGQLATTMAEAAKLAMTYRGNRDLLRARVQAALDLLGQDPRVDPSRIAAIGYCFGGTTVLELARSGAKVAGVVSFHGGLDTPKPAQPGQVKAKVLALHGADDPTVPPQQLNDFEKEMRQAGVDWQLIMYSGAVHGFTNSEADKLQSEAVAYNAAADRRSWQHMKLFLEEIFAKR